MRTVRALQFAVILIFVRSAEKLNAEQHFRYNSNLGVAVEQSGRACLEIRNAHLAEGNKIQFLNSNFPPTAGEATILRKLDQGCTPTSYNTRGLSHYELKTATGILTPSTPAFALANFIGSITMKANSASGDLDGDGHAEVFRSCTSSEGVHLTVWKGLPLRGTRKWHRYYYLGYDVEPSCTKRDTKPGNR